MLDMQRFFFLFGQVDDQNIAEEYLAYLTKVAVSHLTLKASGFSALLPIMKKLESLSSVTIVIDLAVEPAFKKNIQEKFEMMSDLKSLEIISTEVNHKNQFDNIYKQMVEKV